MSYHMYTHVDVIGITYQVHMMAVVHIKERFVIVD